MGGAVGRAVGTAVMFELPFALGTYDAANMSHFKVPATLMHAIQGP